MSPPQFNYARRAQREPAAGSATLSWEALGEPCECSIRLCNLTADGLQAVGPKSLAPGTAVFVSGARYECAGEIRYCLAVGAEYRFGVEFRSDPYPVVSAVRLQ